MRIPAHLRLSRHGIYYFRIIVPKALRPDWGGRSEIKISLRTRDQRIALQKARDLALSAYKRFGYSCRNMNVQNPFDPNDPSTWPTANDLRKFETTHEIVRPDGTIERFHTKADPNSPADIAAAKESVEKHYARIGVLRPPNSPEAQAFFLAEEAEIANAIENGQRACETTETAERSGSGRNSTAMAGAERPTTNANRRTEQTSKRGASDRMLTALWPRFKLHMSKSKWRTDRSVKGNQAKFNIFLEWHGDAHIEDVSNEDISAYKDYLLGEYISVAGKTQGDAGLNGRTVDNYIGVLAGLYKWAKKNGVYPREWVIPTEGHRLVSKKDIKIRAQSGKANRAFKSDELISAFSPKNYLAQNRESHHFWPPLLALFTGMRLAEVSQLALGDILVEDGMWAISINDEDYKRLKSAAATRTIPVHPELINLGFIDFVSDVRALSLGPQLFPVLRPTANGEYGNAPGKKWGRYLTDIGLTDEALTYHSFRRTAATLLKKAKVPFDVRCQMVGHENDHVSEIYSSEYSVSDLADLAMSAFKFPNLDLSGLKYEAQQFDDAIKDAWQKLQDEDAKAAKQAKSNQPDPVPTDL